LFDVAPVFPDLLRDVENLSPQLVGVRHFDSHAVGQDDDSERRTDAEMVFDEQQTRTQLEPVPVINPPSGRLEFLRNQEFALSYDPVRPTENLEPLRDKKQVIEGDGLTGTQAAHFACTESQDDEDDAQEDDDQAENERRIVHRLTTNRKMPTKRAPRRISARPIQTILRDDLSTAAKFSCVVSPRESSRSLLAVMPRADPSRHASGQKA
jgi:hypothetical protein